MSQVTDNVAVRKLKSHITRSPSEAKPHAKSVENSEMGKLDYCDCWCGTSLQPPGSVRHNSCEGPLPHDKQPNEE